MIGAGETLRLAGRALGRNKLRSFLTALGIIIGVGAVIAMLALGDGSKAQVLSRIEAMGTDLLLVRPGARNVRTRDESAALVQDDAEAIGELPNVREAVAEYGRAVTVRQGGNDYTTMGTGATANYARARNWPLTWATVRQLGISRKALRKPRASCYGACRMSCGPPCSACHGFRARKRGSSVGRASRRSSWRM